MFTKAEKAILWLDIFDNLSIKKKYIILNAYEKPEDIFDNFKKDFNRFKHILDSKMFAKMSYALDENFINNQLVGYENMRVIPVTIASKNYSKLLLTTAVPPLVLYCKGDVSLLNATSLAIVGTRRCTRYGKSVTKTFAKELSLQGYCIVAGLCHGIDTIAHEETLANNGKTIAVLGGGVNEVYPASNRELAKEIVEKGLLISEYKPNSRPVGYHFPIRNRIIAGLCDGVVITEAGVKSGAMHTKEYALEAERDLFVVPGNIDNFASKGCNRIIKSLQGCMVTGVEDILEVYGKNKLKAKGKSSNSIQLSIEEQLILNILKSDEVHYDELLVKTKLDPKKLNTLLTTMQVRGLISKLPGNFYAV